MVVPVKRWAWLGRLGRAEDDQERGDVTVRCGVVERLAGRSRYATRTEGIERRHRRGAEMHDGMGHMAVWSFGHAVSGGPRRSGWYSQVG